MFKDSLVLHCQHYLNHFLMKQLEGQHCDLFENDEVIKEEVLYVLEQYKNLELSLELPQAIWVLNYCLTTNIFSSCMPLIRSLLP